MKTFKFTHLILILLFPIVVLSSCQKDNINAESNTMSDKTLPAEYGEIFEQLATTVFFVR